MTGNSPTLKTPRLRVRITAAAERKVRAGHPWVYADSIAEQNRPGLMGELAVIYDRQDQFMAIGLWDGDSPLRIRILHVGKPQTIDTGWWRSRLMETAARREAVASPDTNGYRWVSGESDGWPGMVVDRYDDTCVLKLYTLAWMPRLYEILGLIQEVLKPNRVVLRLSRNIQEAAAQRHHFTDGQVISGTVPQGPVIFLESGIRFEAEVVRGQKTGFFLDQRENRRRVQALAAGRTMLNAFSFSGGFSLYAARGGARSTLDLDISAHALESANRNHQLNAADPAIGSCPHETVQADVFEWFEGGHGRTFDLLVVDPPSLARREAERAAAIAAYGRLVRGALACARPRAILVFSSCSAHVSEDEFYNAVLASLQSSGRGFREMSRTEHAPDHPATFPEAHYLKCIFVELV